jgi:hypothetical protein
VTTIWQLRRLPEAQAKIFEQEMARLDCSSETLSAAEVMARRFSEDGNNGFAVLHRYGSGIPLLYPILFPINMAGAQEVCIYMFVWMAKFGAAYGVRTGIHVGVD